MSRRDVQAQAPLVGPVYRGLIAVVALLACALMAGLTALALALDQSTRAVTDQVTARTHDATESAGAAARGCIEVLIGLLSAYVERPASGRRWPRSMRCATARPPS